MQFGCFRRKSRARRLSRFALPIVSNEKHSWFSAEIDLHLFSCIVVLWTFSVVLGLFSCCVSEIAALQTSSAVTWSSYVEGYCIKFADCTKYFRYDPKLVSEQWSTTYLMGKWTWIEFCPHCGSMQFGCFRTKSSVIHFSRFRCSQPILLNEKKS